MEEPPSNFLKGVAESHPVVWHFELTVAWCQCLSSCSVQQCDAHLGSPCCKALAGPVVTLFYTLQNTIFPAILGFSETSLSVYQFSSFFSFSFWHLVFCHP